MNPSEDQELEYVPIEVEWVLCAVIIHLAAIGNPEVLDSLLAESV